MDDKTTTTEKERCEVVSKVTGSRIANKVVPRGNRNICSSISEKTQSGRNGRTNTKRSRNNRVPVRRKANAKPIKMNKKTPTYKNLRDNISNCDKKLKDRDKEIFKSQK